MPPRARPSRRHIRASIRCLHAGVAFVLGTTAMPAAAAGSVEPAASGPGEPATAAPDPADSQGAPSASADALSDRAVERFEARDFDGAVELFTAAHALDPQPNYLFNIGRVYEEKGDLAKAVEYYQRFVGEPGVDLESRSLATERLRVLREALEQLRTETKNDAEEATPLPPVSTRPDDGSAPPSDTPRPSGKGRKLRITGYSLLGVGGAALLGGSVVGGIALRTTRDADDAMFVDEQAALRREARTRAAAADALFVSGGVLAAVGLVIVLSTLGPGRRAATAARRRRDRATTWAPLVTREGAAVSVTHRF